MDTGSAWKPKVPVRSLYQAKLLLMLCEEVEFHLAQEITWWKPSKMPGPAEWVTIRRIRLKDAINTLWWLAKTLGQKRTIAEFLSHTVEACKH